MCARLVGSFWQNEEEEKPRRTRERAASQHLSWQVRDSKSRHSLWIACASALADSSALPANPGVTVSPPATGQPLPPGQRPSAPTQIDSRSEAAIVDRVRAPSR